MFTFLTIAFIVAAVVLAVSGVSAERRRKAINGGYATSVGFPRQFTACILGAAALVLVVVLICGTADLTARQLDADKMETLLPRKVTQREALIAQVETRLSNDEYAQLIGITDPNAFVVFAQGTAVSDYLIVRAGQIVALNADIFALENDLASQRLDVCNDLRNPFYPRLPFVGPDCEYAN